MPYHRAHGPSSTLYSNAVDMCRYALSHLHKCRGASANDDAAGFIDMTSYEQMWSKHAVTGYGDMLNDMGLGWFIGEYKGRRVMSHMGRDTGFRSNFWLLPDEGIAIIVMMNADYIGNKVLCEAILDVLFGDEVPYIRRSLAHHLSQVTLAAGVDAAIQEYAEIQQSCPERFLVLEGEFNAGAYTLMGRGSLQEGIRVLQLSVQLFPESSNLHDSLGEMYRLAGERELALKHYQRSVELDSEHLDGKRMIEELLQEGQS
ncbi:serine hydrolase [Paenibacillus sp. JCM 10914]|uniref:serine hydrolase n=1 Tax=Paenibacillus sp. JCM 10914 TaxID=1236974 RepID=UPI0009DE38EE